MADCNPMPAEAAAMVSISQSPNNYWRLVSALLVPVLTVIMLISFALVVPRILWPRNLMNVALQTSYLAVFATAQTLVIVARGFDLSLGTCVSMVSVIAAVVMVAVAGPNGDAVIAAVIVGVVTAVASGALVGLFNGAVSAGFGVNPFIVTLGTLNICYGIASTISGGRPVFDIPYALSIIFYNGSVLGIPVPILIAAAACLGAHFLLDRTVIGRSLYLIGGNPRAAVVAGIPVRRYLVFAYMFASTLAALGSLMLTARTGSGEPALGGNLLLQSIAAAVIGGVSLRGGIGTVRQAVLGALFITILSNGMNLARIDGYVQEVVLGIFVVAAVFLDALLSRRA